MNILLVYPTYPDTFWSFKYALKFISKKASLPPLGLLTVSAMLPAAWKRKLIDMNVEKLKDKDILWADYVFISGMSIQKESAKSVISRCASLGVPVIAGGPMFTAGHEEFEEVAYFVLNEAEITLPQFLDDLEKGQPKRVYTTDLWADITKTPVPDWDLLKMNKYASMNIQYSRGCPFDCEFCNITVLYGRRPRTKDKEQLLAELESLHARGWKGGIFLVDDNFIGNKAKLKNETLPAVTEWMKSRKYPFPLFSEVSINLADDEELMSMMARAGFDTVFVGIESPHEESLVECSKFQNNNRDLTACVQKIQQFGMEVQGGFIVGFDSDPASIFDRLVAFIQESGIVTAMVGLLNAPPGTKLYQRMLQENRLLRATTGDNTDFSINFIPKMDHDALLNGYRRIVKTIYSPKQHYARIKQFLKNYQPAKERVFHLQFSHLKAAFKSVYRLGIFGRERFYYWRLFFWSLFRKPRLLPLAITLSIYGHHFRRIFRKHELFLQ